MSGILHVYYFESFLNLTIYTRRSALKVDDFVHTVQAAVSNSPKSGVENTLTGENGPGPTLFSAWTLNSNIV